MAVELGRSYILEEFLLEPEKRVLSRDGKQVRLANRPFQVLLYLIENHDRLVRRDELLEKFWDGRDVYDEALTKAVGAIRKALNEPHESPRFIETRWAEGYRFIGNLENFSEASVIEIERTREIKFVLEENSEFISNSPQEMHKVNHQPVFQTDNQITDSRKYTKKIQFSSLFSSSISKLVIILALFVGASAFIGFQINRQFSQTVRTNSAPINSIAVLPFKNLTSDAEKEIFIDGMTENLISSLSKIENLKVISRNSVFTFKGKDVDPREVGQKLGVGSVLEGSVQANGDKIRVEVRLVNTQNGEIIWSGAGYEKPFGDVFEIQDEIARSVTTNLRLKLSPADEQRLTNKQPDDIAAYQAYLKGLHYRNQMELPKAIEFYKEALQIEPNYAAAHEGLAVVYTLMEFNSQVPPGTAAPLAEFHANQALAKDENLVGAYISLGAVKTLKNYDLEERIRYYREAIRRNPNYLTAHRWLSSALLAQGKFEETESELLYVQEIDPLSYGVRLNLAELYYYWRKPDKTIEQANLMLIANPNDVEAHGLLSKAYFQKGMFAEAEAEFKKYDPNTLPISVLVKTGRITEARKVAAKFVNENAKSSPYLVACAFARIGEREKALMWLEKAYEMRQADLVSIKIDPAFDDLRDDARFQDLQRRVGLKK
jgi:TolB-like protein/DNA-binding winged helix-turn-helix (wHTH) protein/cytochrome c-type biogenesis protein CcmH/NrfG